MASYIPAICAGLRQVVVATWPEIEDNGLYHSLELVRTLDSKLSAGEVPFALYEWRGNQPWDPRMVGRADQTVYEVWRITNSGDIEQLVEELEDLRDALVGQVLGSYGQVYGYPTVHMSLADPVNRYLRATQKPLWSGSVMLNVLAGYSL